MSTAPEAADYAEIDNPERALKYAIQHVQGDRVEIIEGVITPVSPTWDHENAVEEVRDQIKPRAKELGLMTGSGNLDLPGSPNWYVPDIAVVPKALAKGGSALFPDQSLLVVEVTSESNGDSDRVAKRKRYAEYGAPLYLLVDRQESTWTLFSHPSSPLGYTKREGPHPFGTPIPLPEPFALEIQTDEL